MNVCRFHCNTARIFAAVGSEYEPACMVFGPIMRRISARLAGLRFLLGFLNKSSQKDGCDYMKRVSGWAEISSRFLKFAR